jgi:isopenicillin N synthase-like dioxygenase
MKVLSIYLFLGIASAFSSFEIPQIDLYHIINWKNDEISSVQVGKSIHKMDIASKQLGCFILTNVSANLRLSAGDSLASAYHLFDLPLEVKKEQSFNATHHFGRGYLSFGAESGLLKEYFEPKEGYSYGHPGPHEKDYGWLSSPNRWPSALSKDDQLKLEYVSVKFGNLANMVVSTLLEYSNNERAENEQVCLDLNGGEEISLMRMFHYLLPPADNSVDESDTIHGNNDNNDNNANHVSQKEKKKKIQYLGSSPHTDWGLLTVILQNEISGLQFYYNENWIDVPNIPDSLIINIGDYFSLVTKGYYHSPIHRVLCPTKQDRLSFVYFYYPSYDSKLIIPSTVSSSSVGNNKNKKKESTGSYSSMKGNEQDLKDGAVEEEDQCGEDVCYINKKENPKDHQIETKKFEMLSFNTLTVREPEVSDESTSPVSDGHSSSFGEYIMFKWRSVLRQ